VFWPRVAMSDHIIGTVKWFNSEKGYGFIICEGRDVFVHSKRLRESGFVAARDAVVIKLEPGEKLKFQIENGPKGPFAIDISRV
jgi:CspA family cold shock protein